MKRTLALLAAITLSLGLAAPASAEPPTNRATDDWSVINGWSGLANKRVTGWFGYPVSPSRPTQAEGWGRVDWSGTTVEVHAGAHDVVNDGACAVTEIRYKIYIGGAWSDDWHYRSPAVDCDINGGQVISSYYRSRYPTKDLHFRVCLGGRDGSTYPPDCTADWH